MPTILELRQNRANLWEQQKAILDRSDPAKGMTTEDQATYDRLESEMTNLESTITRMEKHEAEKRRLSASAGVTAVPQPSAGPDTRTDPRDTDEYRGAFARFLRAGKGALSGDEFRALQVDNPTLGGYISPSMMFINQLIKQVDDAVYIRQLATKFRSANAESLGVPTLDANPADADWTSELKTGSEDGTMAFGKRELRPHPLAKRIKVSNKLLRSSLMDVEGLVRDRLAYKFGITHEKGFLLGSGAEQPLGVFTASTQGITTARDISTGNTNSAITADGLIEAKYGLKVAYHQKARWIFHRDAIKMIRKLKDGEGNYLWRAGITNDRGDTILDVPYFISEYAPNTFTTGKYVGIIGDFSFYWIADALDLAIQRLDELYAETNQVGFIGRWESDGMPVLEEAFVRVTLA